ncbi:PD-(D/E)XK nuclease family protein [Rhodococcus sp. 11-3]|uniref:PD-(D/E)XK nuclease family protein n=1 Tax=Rhodococcus sp. 11-3 TaxID=2854796 RepID=UPI0020421237|nr:PD-(D/E)XK nuclease family protein [Rhodococcus sp. 11-3]USC16982.1 PD-(D/E)XK nuclease family protein [Rhodococcus sp. 11-3]
MTQEAFFDVDRFDPDALLEDLRAMIWNGYMSIPRHNQVELGPSEIGDGCARKLAYLTFAKEHGKPNFVDPLPSLTGTALHTIFDEFAGQMNEKLGWNRWEHEREVFPAEGFHGHCDLYDHETKTVVDWKNLGKASSDKMLKNGPRGTYRGQLHTYGLGYERAGFEVKNVAICVMPVGSLLRYSHLWSEPYDRQLALDTIDRYHQIIALSDQLQVVEHPERFALIPHTPSEDSCQYCPFKSAEPGPYNCPGK